MKLPSESKYIHCIMWLERASIKTVSFIILMISKRQIYTYILDTGNMVEI